jgi:hypothetical protein
MEGEYSVVCYTPYRFMVSHCVCELSLATALVFRLFF